jgi:uncharacterized membrane protein YozB (DUF420 family)
MSGGEGVNRDSLIRKVLWTTVFCNVLAASAFAFPASLGQLAGLPVPVAPIYSMLLTFFVLLFAAAYAWLARQPQIDRPMLAMSAAGKAGVFFIAVALWMVGEGPGLLIPGAVGDFVFAALFVWWLRGGTASRAS